jgi:type 1 glutamine amidotransferase
VAANVVCGASDNSHDIDFARMRILDVLYGMGGIRTECFGNYKDIEAIEAGDLLISYTSLMPADPAQAAALRRYLEKGGRWFAIHASNYFRDDQPLLLPDILGSRFATHPPYGHFTVAVAKPDDPLLKGIPATFEVDDELYVLDKAPDLEVLLHAKWGGTGVLNRTIPEGMHPMMYKRRVGQGAVLYLTLGHSSRSFAPPQADGTPATFSRHGSWDSTVVQEIIKRSIEWAAKRRPL